VFIVHFHYVRYYLLGSHVLVFVVLCSFLIHLRNLLVMDLFSRIPPLVNISFGCYMSQLIRHLYMRSRLLHIRIDIR